MKKIGKRGMGKRGLGNRQDKILQNKRGDGMSISTVVVIVVLVIGFLILLYLYWAFNWSERVDSEVCHESIVLRATASTILGDNIVSSSVGSMSPLRCRTDKVCITADTFGKCKEFEGLSGVTRVRVSDKSDIEQALARLTLDCWSMTGEGRISVFNHKIMKDYGFGTVESDCLVCARVAYDALSLEKKKIYLADTDVGRYMDTHLVSGKDLTYTQYLSGGSPAKFSIQNDNSKIKEGGASNLFENPNSGQSLTGELDSDKNLLTKETAVIFMQVQGPPNAEEGFWNGVKTLGLGLGVTASFSPRAAIGLAKTLFTTKVGLIGLAAVGIWQQYEIAKNQAVSASFCQDVTVAGEGRRQCSVVRTMTYNSTNIARYCDVIESIP